MLPENQSSPQKVRDLERNKRIELVVEERDGELLERVVCGNHRFRKHLPHDGAVTAREREARRGRENENASKVESGREGEMEEAGYWFGSAMKEHLATSVPSENQNILLRRGSRFEHLEPFLPPFFVRTI